MTTRGGKKKKGKKRKPDAVIIAINEFYTEKESKNEPYSKSLTPKYFILASLEQRKREKMDPFFFSTYIFILGIVSGYKIYTTKREKERERET